jgi:cellulose biosynthesis protein BcsQ
VSDYLFSTHCKVVMGAKKKGGSGNSTMILLTAFAYAKQHPDETVAVVCADNTTYTLSTFLAAARVQHPDVTPPIKSYQWKERHGMLADCVIAFCEQQQVTTVFIDMAPDSNLLEQNIKFADLVLVPTQCAYADAERAIAVNELATANGIPVIVSLNRMSRAKKGQARHWRTALEKHHIYVSDFEAINHLDYSSIWGDLDTKTLYNQDDADLLKVDVEYPTNFGAFNGLSKEVSGVLTR